MNPIRFIACLTLSSLILEAAEKLPTDTPPVGESIAPLDLPGIDALLEYPSTTETNAMVLRLDEIVRMALANNPQIKIQRLEPEIGATDIRKAWGLFDPKLGFETSYTQSDIPQNAQQYIATGGETTRSQLALLDQLIILQDELDDILNQIQGNPSSNDPAANAPQFTDPRNFSSQDWNMAWKLGGVTPLGTDYALTFTQLQERNDLNIQIPPSLFYPEITTFAGLTISQPLLKNFGPAATMAGVRIARLQKRIGWYEWQRQLIATLSQTSSQFFDLTFANENLRVRREAVAAARLLEQQNIARVNQGKMRPSDVWEAQASLAANVDFALRASNTCIEAQNALKALVFTEQMAFSQGESRILPASQSALPFIPINRAIFLAEGLKNRPEYQHLLAKAEQEGLRVRYEKNQALPLVNLQASGGLTGLEGEYGSSFGQTFGGQGTSYAVGMVVSIPLGNVEADAKLEAARLRQQQTLLAVQKAATEIAIEIDTSISLLETSRLQVVAARATADAAVKTAFAEQKLLDEGKSTTFEVVRLQNNAADARSRELAAIAQYRKNAVRLAVARGTLLSELGISIEDEALKTSIPNRRNQLDTPWLKPGERQEKSHRRGGAPFE